MVRLESDGSVLHVVLDRPEVRNALDDVLIARLTQIFSELDHAVRVVILRGEGSVFCAGGDLNYMQRQGLNTEAENVADALKLSRLFHSIAQCRPCVIAKVHGAAMGGGAGLVAAADVSIALEGTKFSFSEVKLGIIPGTISPFVINKIGPGHARALFATGELFTTDRALRIGLLQEVAKDDEHLDQLVQNVVKNVLASGPSAVSESKKLVLDSPLSSEETAKRLAAARASSEGKEGLAAFLEKRPASFVEKR